MVAYNTVTHFVAPTHKRRKHNLMVTATGFLVVKYLIKQCWLYFSVLFVLGVQQGFVDGYKAYYGLRKLNS